jgi:hypothetical protein
MLLQPIRHLGHHAVKRRVVIRPQTALRSEKSLQRINSSVQSITDEYGAEDTATGFMESFTEHAFDSLNQQLRDSSLPSFLQDQLCDSMKDSRLNSTPSDTSTVNCRNHTDTMCKEFLPLYDHQTPPVIEKRIITDKQPHAPVAKKVNVLQNSWSWQRNLTLVYNKMAYNAVQSSTNSEISEETFNWVLLLAGAMAALQIQFIQAAMDNLKTMRENTGFAMKSQEALDAMSSEDRNSYIELRDGRRRKFITAQSHFRVNIHFFHQTTIMAKNMFGMFSKH